MIKYDNVCYECHITTVFYCYCDDNPMTLQVANDDAFHPIIVIITTTQLVNIPALLISLRRSGLLWELPCAEIKGSWAECGRGQPSGEEKKEETVDFHFSLWKFPLRVHFNSCGQRAGISPAIRSNWASRGAFWLRTHGSRPQVLGKLSNKNRFVWGWDTQTKVCLPNSSGQQFQSKIYRYFPKYWALEGNKYTRNPFSPLASPRTSRWWIKPLTNPLGCIRRKIHLKQEEAAGRFTAAFSSDIFTWLTRFPSCSLSLWGRWWILLEKRMQPSYMTVLCFHCLHLHSCYTTHFLPLVLKQNNRKT